MVAQPEWLCPPETLGLPAGAVHIWRASLLLPEQAVSHYTALISRNEQERAQRFRFERDRRRFVVSRGILRSLLGRYLNLGPEQIQFDYGQRGKPFLAAAPGRLEFNLSHSEDWMVCAVSQDCQVGIDLECPRPLADLQQLSQRFFAPSEHAAIAALPVEQQLEAFLQYWTTKEALLKAVGAGLTNLSTLEIAITDGVPQLVSWQGQTVAHWRLMLFEPVPDWVAAIALNQPSIVLTPTPHTPPNHSDSCKFWQWQEHDAKEAELP